MSSRRRAALIAVLLAASHSPCGAFLAGLPEICPRMGPYAHPRPPTARSGGMRMRLGKTRGRGAFVQHSGTGRWSAAPRTRRTQMEMQVARLCLCAPSPGASHADS